MVKRRTIVFWTAFWHAAMCCVLVLLVSTGARAAVPGSNAVEDSMSVGGDTSNDDCGHLPAHLSSEEGYAVPGDAIGKGAWDSGSGRAMDL